MGLIAKEMPWQQAKDKFWRSCASLGGAGTKEKERNIQKAIFEQGTDVV
ncbi:hypothetical protein [Peribacillus saganii]|nr:hypothetical protein [Peribacillus saganii]